MFVWWLFRFREKINIKCSWRGLLTKCVICQLIRSFPPRSQHTIPHELHSQNDKNEGKPSIKSPITYTVNIRLHKGNASICFAQYSVYISGQNKQQQRKHTGKQSHKYLGNDINSIVQDRGELWIVSEQVSPSFQNLNLYYLYLYFICFISPYIMFHYTYVLPLL